MNSRYQVRAMAADLGQRDHIIRATSPDAAWDRYRAAYPDRECIKISVSKLSHEEVGE